MAYMLARTLSLEMSQSSTLAAISLLERHTKKAHLGDHATNRPTDSMDVAGKTNIIC